MKFFALILMMFVAFAAASHHQGCMLSGELVEHGTHIKLEDLCYTCDDGVLESCKCDSTKFILPTGTTSPPSPSSAAGLENIF